MAAARPNLTVRAAAGGANTGRHGAAQADFHPRVVTPSSSKLPCLSGNSSRAAHEKVEAVSSAAAAMPGHAWPTIRHPSLWAAAAASAIGIVQRRTTFLLGLSGMSGLAGLSPDGRAAAIQILIEKGVVGSGAFSLIGVAGCLVGSALCFVEGCCTVLKSFFHCLRHWGGGGTPETTADPGELVRLVIESMDMYLVGTALLTFGMGLYVMFVGSKKAVAGQSVLARSSLGLFDLERLKQRLERQSIMKAKGRVGHAVLLLFQAGVVEHFRNTMIVSGLDMACLGCAVFLSSASVFVLSRLSAGRPVAPPSSS